MPASDAAAQVQDWLIAFPCAAVSAYAVRTALADAAAGRASYWDGLMIASAAEAGCTLILTEALGQAAGSPAPRSVTRSSGAVD